jgi:hypothetical protein
VATPIEVEVYDQNTGQRIADPSLLPDLNLTIEFDGRTVELNDNGKDGDREAGDGILTGAATFDTAGDQPIPIRIENELLDRTVTIKTRVIDAAWLLEVASPRQVEVDSPMLLSIQLKPIGALSALTPPERIEVMSGGQVTVLHDNGTGGDSQPDDHIFSTTWTPREIGLTTLDYVPRGGTAAPTISAPLEVTGKLILGEALPVNLGRTCSSSEVEGTLDLSRAMVRGSFEAQVSSDFELKRAILELDIGNGWIRMNEEPINLQLREGGRLTWPVRLRVGSCPGGSTADQSFDIDIEARGVDNQLQHMAVPLRVEVIPDAWLVCWWPVLALIGTLVLVSVVVHGYWLPARFPPRLGVVLSPEEDPDEGFFHPIRAVRGSGAGFYRDARIWISSDFRLTSSPRGALARLRACGTQVKIVPVPGTSVWRQTADETWERLPAEEITARFGTLYRNDLSTLFFTIRNG